MKALLVPFLWVGAFVVAGYVVYRLWRGKPMILRGKLGPRVLRCVAILLVTFGLGVDDKAAAAQRVPTDPPGKAPAVEPPAKLGEDVTLQQIENWLHHQRALADNELGLGDWRLVKAAYARLLAGAKGDQAGLLRAQLTASLQRLPPDFAALLKADIDALGTGKAPAPRKAEAVLKAARAMEAQGYFDSWLIAYLWRWTAPLDATTDPQAVELMGVLARQVRVTHALLKANAQVKPADLGPRAWMSKAGPPANFGRMGFDRAGVAQLAAVYTEECKRADLGPWLKDGVVRLAVPEKGPVPTLLRDGKPVELKPGETVRLGRLDALKTPAGADTVLEHETFGAIRLPAGQTLLVWDLSRLLDDAGRQAVGRAVRAALDGKEDAALQVEQSLPLCQRLLREELVRAPGAPGAAKMRLVLALFDDAVIVPPPDRVPQAPPAFPGGR